MKLRHILSILFCAAAFSAAAQSGCNPLSLPFSEDFDNHGAYATLPPCWVASRNYDLGPPPGLDSAQRHSGTRALMLYSGTIASSHYSIVITPELDTTSLDGLFLRMRYYAASTSTRLEVGLCVDTGRYTRQFTPVDNGSIYNTPSSEAVRAAQLCLEGVNTVGKSLFFLNPSIADASWFNSALTYYTTIGGHAFYI